MVLIKYIVLSCLALNLYAQTNKDIRIPTLNEEAPSFTATSTQGSIKFPDDYFNKWLIIFSHPADFTPVCTTEIWELAQMQKEFEDLNTKILILSTDGLNSHLEWIKSIEGLEYKGKKSEKINFPLISDVNMEISKKYGMIHPYLNSTLNVRGVFIINPKDHIQYIAFYPSNVGRNLEEIKRVLVALQESYSQNVLTPANWKSGDDYLISSPKSIAESENLKAKNSDNLYSFAWYLWFKKNK